MLKINRSSKKFKLISLVFMGIISCVIIKVFIDNWHKVPINELEFNLLIFSVSFVLSGFISGFSAWLWRYILVILGENISFMNAWRITVYSQIFRYLPGKLWQYMGKVYWGNKIGLSNKNILLSTFLETIFLMGGSFIASLFSLPLFIQKGYLAKGYVLIILPLIAVPFVLILNPRVLNKIFSLVGNKFLTKAMVITFPCRKIVLLILLYLFLWMLLGFQLFLLVLSLYKIPFSQYLYLSSFNALSWLVGFLSILAPSGIGVKEGVFILGFKIVVPVSFAIICAIVIRFYTIITDVVITVVFFIFDKGAWKNLIEFRKTSKTVKADTNEPKEQK